MAQNGEDMSATDQSDAAPSVLADNADETQAEIATIPVSDTMTMLASANENAEAAQDNVQMNAPSSTVTADAPVEEATAATEDTSKTPSDGNDEVGQPASFSDAAPQALLAPSEDMPSVAAGSAVTMVTDENKADSLDSDQPQTPAIPVHSAGQDELSMSNNMPDKTSEMSPSQGNDAEHAQNNAVHMVTNDGEIPAASEQAADQPQQSANGNTETVLTEQTMEAKAHQPDSDIEEGEELGSPPPAQTQQETIPRHRSKSPSAGAISRRREGRSRSPERERRPSPQRGQPKASVNREELFKVYIGGLPEKTELQDLEDCFGQFGEIGHIELKLGYAFIVSPVSSSLDSLDNLYNLVGNYS